MNTELQVKTNEVPSFRVPVTTSKKDREIAERIVPAAGGRSHDYPCRFKWEITDDRLVSRFMERLRTSNLTLAQFQWYLSRCNFRALIV